MKDFPKYLKLFGFAVLGALVDYFVFPYLTPLIGFSQGLGGIGNVRIANVTLGIVVFSLLAKNLKQYVALLFGGLVGALFSTALSPLLAAFLTHFIWYSIFDWPVFSSQVFEPLRALLWLIFVIGGVILVVKLSKNKKVGKTQHQIPNHFQFLFLLH